VIATDLDGVITEWNEAATKLYGYTSEEVVGRRISEVTGGVFDRARARDVTKKVMSNGSWEGEFEVRRRDGSTFPAHVRNTLIKSADGSPIGIVGVSADMSDRRNRERRASGEREYLRAITESMGEGLFALDSEGRLTFLNQAGEQLLGWREHELQGQVMHDLTHYRQPDGSPLPRESCGILPSRRDGETVRVRDDFFVRKDGSMLPVAYTAAPFETDQGVRGSVIVFSDITEQKRRQQQLQATIDSLAGVERIRQALDRDGLLVYAQPIVELTSRRTVLHELLVRMRGVDDDRVIGPGEFLPIAEDDGIIVEIDRWMLGRAAELAAAGHEISVNVSGRSMFGTAAIDALRAALERTGADASRIVIELTETALVSDTKAAFAFVSATKELGCRIALDDFGTGYGGFSYLKRLPVDVLKIDLEFVQDLISSSSSQSVVQAVVSLADSFGYKTIAEGVEDEATARALAEYGVDLAQGYLFARPAPVAEVLAVDASRAAP
jgi:PAS domain S-box-containing protein